MTELTMPANLKVERQLAVTEEKLLPAAFRELSRPPRFSRRLS
jgi:hypothetical protein